MKMQTHKSQTSLTDEIAVDLFAGGGGWSTGFEMATGDPIEAAVNHDPAAVLMHKTNHPYTCHYCESVYDVPPLKATRGRPVGWLHASPDCKHFSKAKGGKPVDKEIRGLAWAVHKWAGIVHPRIISMENVGEFVTWGPLVAARDKKTGRALKLIPLSDGTYRTTVAEPGEVVPYRQQMLQPDKKRAGQHFRAFVRGLEHMGYAVEWRELVASHYGAPTNRKRFFLIARNDGKPIVWPEPTHGDPKSPEVQSGKLKPWRTAAEVIEWSQPCPSIFTRKRPLANNTVKRIARGLDKFVIKNPQPFIVGINHRSERFRGQSVDDPLGAITSKLGRGIAAPVITKFQQNSIGSSPDAPIDTVMPGAARFGVTAPHLIQYHSEQSGRECRGQSIEAPLLTVDGANRYGLVSPTLVEVGYGEAPGQLPRAPGVDKPLGTIVSKQKHALVATHIMKMKGQDVGQPSDTPLHTITAGGKHFADIASYLAKYYGQGTGQRADEPLDTITTKDRFGFVTVSVKRYAGGAAVGFWPQIREMLNTHLEYNLAEDEILVFSIAGIDYIIVDIGLRMLSPRELYNAQGFPPDYQIEYDYEGNKYPKDKQVARCGNAVPPPFAMALVRANWPEKCKDIHLETMADFYEYVAV